jgi:hypothetical protein
VSLNNRIAIRDTSSARGAVEIGVDPISSTSGSTSGRSDNTADFLLLESEKHQKQQTVRQPQTEVKVVSERVISKSRNFHFSDFLMLPLQT